MINEIITFFSGSKIAAGLLAAVVASLFLRITSGLFFKVAFISLIVYGLWYLI